MAMSILNFVGFGLTLAFLYVVGEVFYNLFLHPLRHFPGPLLMRAGRIPYFYKSITGTLPFDMLDIHNRYGSVVRIAPNELAFSDPRAWKDIMGHRKQGVASFEKWNGFYRLIPDEPVNVVNAPGEEHASLRRQLAHGFSDASLRGQESIIMKHINLLIRRLHENSHGGTKPVNLMAWYNYTTFDVIGDLAFGEPFGCLDNSDYHPWVRSIFQLARFGTVMQTANHFPPLKKIITIALSSKQLRRGRQQHREFTKAKLQRRIELGKTTERPDLVEGLLKKKEELNLSLDNLVANSSILIIGGSETTATLLSGATYFLMENPASLEKLTKEVRSAFEKEEDIDLTSVNKLEYMFACLEEALRVYPPVPIGLPRVVPKGGAKICDHFIPEDTVVAIHQWAMYHNANNFSDPFGFHPERFMGDAQFASDRKDAFQPFHLGPRNCLGRNLAYVEMKVILARVLWNFDIKISPDSHDWLKKQRVFNFWDKGPLYAYLTPVIGG
ncbi:cytochrome P450 [Biscogniauxia mediterranea]|nr:cytochrome P450 [Biscogniauxia mediterranea]